MKTRTQRVFKNWTSQEDSYIKEWYNEKIKISPAIIAMNLKRDFNQLLKRMRELGLKKTSSYKREVDLW